MVESSSTGINKAHLAGTHDGTVIIPVYNWSSFLEWFFKRVPNIKKYHHFWFSKDEPDRAVIPPASQLPAKLNPAGLSQERKEYLFREIRPFCKPGTEDLVAQAP
ncbi:hypothetical protein pdam_00025330 [Pocillopora damicornis]|uniref:Uncharacterized protein n=1 Tax=Pocillopora damicornis TaxID=46731 RepID=A0A3M6V196_POCDA|nr:hypothetical protein pdam_00025330 [Pocillopora damicornis]